MLSECNRTKGVCVCVCEREREKETERKRERERKRKRERDCRISSLAILEIKISITSPLVQDERSASLAAGSD